MREALDGREVTVALDGVGGALGRGALELLGAGGRLVLFGFSSGEPTSSRPATSSRAASPPRPRSARGSRSAPAACATSRSRRSRPPPTGASSRSSSASRLADAAAAHEAIESRATVGKTVLVP